MYPTPIRSLLTTSLLGKLNDNNQPAADFWQRVIFYETDVNTKH